MQTSCDRARRDGWRRLTRLRGAIPAVSGRAATVFSDARFLAARLLLLPALALLPAEPAFAIARWRGRRRFRNTGSEMKARMRRDVRLVCGSMGESEIDALLEDSAEIISCDELDIYFSLRLGRAGYRKLLRVEGLEHLDAALERGSGAVLFSGHFGGAQGLLGVLAARGHRVFGIGRALDRDPWAQRRVSAWKTRLLERLQNGPLLFAGRGAMQRTLEYLREGRVLYILADAPPGESRRVVEVEFLGRTCRLSYGLVELSETTGAPLLPFFVYYTAAHMRRVVIGEPVELSSGCDAASSTRENLRRCLEPVEAAIRAAPSHWMLWGHFDSLWAKAPGDGDLMDTGRVALGCEGGAG